MKTKTCIFAILLAGGLSNSHAQDTWTQKADFGGGTRGYAFGFSIDSKGYIGSGTILTAMMISGNTILPRTYGHRKLTLEMVLREVMASASTVKGM